MEEEGYVLYLEFCEHGQSTYQVACVGSCALTLAFQGFADQRPILQTFFTLLVVLLTVAP